jgi:hypothetical protein
MIFNLEMGRVNFRKHFEDALIVEVVGVYLFS